MPEFWTWWIESGPATCTELSSGSVRVTTCFVTWSATTAASATAARPAHCHGPAASERSATETGASPLVEDPTRTSFNRPGAGRRCRARPRDRAEPVLADRLAAHLAGAIRAVVDPAERGVDLRQRLLSALGEPLVELAVERRRRRVAEVVVGAAAPDLAELVLDGARVLVVEELDRLREARALLVEERPELAGVDGGQAGSSPVALACTSRRSVSSGPMPASVTVLSREACPETISTSRSARPSVSASSSTTAAFARPSSGAAATRTFQARTVPPDHAGACGARRDAKLEARRAHGPKATPRRSPAPPKARRRSGCRERQFGLLLGVRHRIRRGRSPRTHACPRASATSPDPAAARRRARPPRPCRAPRAAASRRAAPRRTGAPARSARVRVIERASWWASATISSASRFAQLLRLAGGAARPR